MVVLACLAKTAMAAWARGRDGDTLAFDRTLNARTETIDHARNFMAQGDRLLDANGSKPAVLVIVEVRPANAAKGHIHAQLLVAQRGQFGVFDAQVFGRMANNGFHGAVFGKRF
jgi:hypothetical protein